MFLVECVAHKKKKLVVTVVLVLSV